MKKFYLLVVLCVLFQVSAMAGGLNRIAGIGTTDVGIGSDPDGIWFPHNLGSKLQLSEKYLIEVGAELMVPKFTYRDWRGKKFTSKSRIVHPLPIVSFAHRIDEDTVWGIDIHANYGLGASFKDIWYGMDSESLVAGVYIKPFLSRQLTDRLSVGAGPVIVVGMMDWFGPLDINRASLPVRVGLKAKGLGYGFQVGAMYQATDKLAFGLNYLSPVKTELDGRCTVSALGLKIRDSVDLDFKFPDRLDFTVGYQPRADWLFTAQASYFGYSRNTLDSIKVNFDRLLITKPVKLEWKDNYAIYFGVGKIINQWTIGLGAGYMTAAVNETMDFLTPDVPGFDVAGRVKYAGEDFSITASVSYGWGESNSNNKKVTAEILTFGLSGSYRF